jgi:leucyl/phenylalanyl-tRNA--protein transferase
VALVGLVELLTEGDGVAGSGRARGRGRVLDVQWVTSHLAGLGAVEVARRHYLDLLKAAVRLPPPPAFMRPPPG